jgi:putative zinc finger/helix-turn-helix YgiT family protein
MQAEEFNFRSNGVDYPVRAEVPVRVCKDCGQIYEDEEGELARHEATCKALGRLTPREIIQLRESLDLSRREFSELTGIGEASFARWESGDLIQSESNDSLLRLVGNRRNAQCLAELRGVAPLKTAKASHTGAIARPVKDNTQNVLNIDDYRALKDAGWPEVRKRSERFKLSVSAQSRAHQNETYQ